ncbi:MAG TPA: hypothetical protein VHB21_11940, partial [Minicystis sp.]|nr:hypothetical protein [Minicystis sp.]
IARETPGGAAILFAGDAARMMPSFTGDGMAVALRSGRLAAEALLAREPARAYAARYRAEFARRFACSGALHAALLRPSVFSLLAPLAAECPTAVERLFTWTRGKAA